MVIMVASRRCRRHEHQSGQNGNHIPTHDNSPSYENGDRRELATIKALLASLETTDGSYAIEASWREHNRRASNGGLAWPVGAAMAAPVSRQWKGYWQRTA